MVKKTRRDGISRIFLIKPLYYSDARPRGSYTHQPKSIRRILLSIFIAVVDGSTVVVWRVWTTFVAYWSFPLPSAVSTKNERVNKFATRIDVNGWISRAPESNVSDQKNVNFGRLRSAVRRTSVFSHRQEPSDKKKAKKKTTSRLQRFSPRIKI